MKKTVLALVVCVVIILLVLVFLPVFLSSDFFLAKVLERANQQPGQRLRIGDLHIGWSSGLQCDGVEYEDTVQSLRVRIDHIEGNRGLFALLAAPKNPGAFTIQHPVVTVMVGEKKGGRKQSVARDHAAGSRQGKASNGQVKPDTPQRSDSGPALWQELTIQVEIRNGEVILVNGKGEQAFPPGRVNAITSLASGTVQYNLNWQSADKGRLDAQGYINLPSDKKHFLDTLVAKTRLVVKRFQLAPLFALASVQRDGIPEGQGVLDGEMTITGAGRARLDLLGRLECSDLALRGGVLGQDHPRIARLAIDIDGGKKEDNSYHLTTFQLKGDFGHLQATANYGQGQGQVHADGTLYLPFFTHQLPHLLHVEKNASLSTGEFTFSGDLTLIDGKKRVQVQASADHLAGRVQGKPFSWGRAAHLVLAGSSSGKDFTVENVDVQTAFASLSGKGSRDHFTLHGKVDLHKADRQLGTLFSLPWHGSGILSGDIELKPGSGEREQVVVSLRSAKCALNYKGRKVLPGAPLDLQGEILLPRNGQGKQQGIDCSLAARTWPGALSFTGTDLLLQGAAKKGTFSLQSDVELGRIVSVLRALDAMPGQLDGRGQLRVNTEGVLADNLLTLTDPQIKGEHLVLKWQGRVLREPRLVLQGKGKPGKPRSGIAVHGLQVAKNRSSWSPRRGGRIVVHLRKKSVEVHGLSLTSSLADLDIDRFMIDDPARLPEAWQGSLQGRLDLGRLAALFTPAAKKGAKPPLRPQGQLRYTLKGDQMGAPYALSLHGSVKDLRLQQAEKLLYSDPAVSFDVQTSGPLRGEKLLIKALRVATAPVDLQATGELHKNKTVNLQGEHVIRYAQLARSVHGLTGKEFALQGEDREKFTLAWPLQGSWQEQAQLATRMVIDSFSFAGIEAEKVTIPLQVAGGTVTTGIEGTLNQGRIAARAELQAKADPAVLSMPPHQKVLSDVRINKPLTEGILSRLHPLFGILARPSGQVSATVESFSWPLPKKYQNDARFKVIFDTSQINLVSQGVLAEILQLLSVKEQQLYLKQSQVTCNCEQGRVQCSPVKVLVADSEMTISGSVGLDKSIDYLIEIPMTEKLIGREGARVLEGTVIEVPIRGTLGKPLFDRSIITEMLANLAGQAAKKAIKKEVEKLVPGLFQGLKF